MALNSSAYGLTSPVTARNIHICPSYTALSLPPDIARVYDLFYPNSNLTPKLALTQAYLSLVHGCGLEEAMTDLDPRVTYAPLSEETYRKPTSISIGIPTTENAQNLAIALRVFNFEYRPSFLPTQLTRTISIEQQSSTTEVRFFEELSQFGSATLTFTDGYSNLVTVNPPENSRAKLFDFYIKHPTSPAFTSTAAKKWEVSFTLPALDLVTQLLPRLLQQRASIDTMLTRYAGIPTTTNYDEMWYKHFNNAYRIAGLFIGLVYRMNVLTQSQ